MRADEAGKVSVLKLQFHNTVEFKVLLSTLKPLGFRKATAPEYALNPAGRDSMAASAEGKGAWNAGRFQEQLPESTAMLHPCTGLGRGQDQRPSGLHRELCVCQRAHEAAAQCLRLRCMTMAVSGAQSGSAGILGAVLIPTSEKLQPLPRTHSESQVSETRNLGWNWESD